MRTKKLSSRQKWGIVFILPWVLFFCVFSVYPIFLAIKNSFLDVNFLQPALTRFVGLENWISAASSPLFWKSIFNVVYNQAIFITLTLALGLLFATLLYEVKALAALFRTIFFLPVITSALVAMLILNYLASPQGPIQASLLNLHILKEPVFWTMEKWLPMPVIALFNSWKWFGIQMIIFLAGIAGIGKEIYEAANIDGAGWWAKFFKITLPSLKPQIVFVLTMNIINGLQMFTEVFSLFNVNGGPYGSAMTPVLYLYNEGFYNMNMGMASAIGLLLALIIFVMTKIQLRIVQGKGG